MIIWHNNNILWWYLLCKIIPSVGLHLHMLIMLESVIIMDILKIITKSLLSKNWSIKNILNRLK